MDNYDVARLFPTRHEDSNKGDFGKAYIITGSRGMTGSGLLCARAAMRTGCGLTYLCVPSSLSSIYETAFAESITVPVIDDNSGHFCSQSADEVLSAISGADAIAIGPGMTATASTHEILAALLKNCTVPLVIDADGLNTLAWDPAILMLKKSTVILTPHPGEMARLAKVSINDIQKSRFSIAADFAKTWGVFVVLKGAGTIVASPDGSWGVFSEPNSGMATAGTGDVLTGIIVSLLAQGCCAEEAAKLGVRIHSLAGDIAVNDKGEHGMIASDLAESIPYAIKKLLL